MRETTLDFRRWDKFWILLQLLLVCSVKVQSVNCILQCGIQHQLLICNDLIGL